jgi:hypothetical protein
MDNAITHRFHYRKSLLNSLVLFILTATVAPLQASALGRIPTGEEINKYRQTWNPLSHGPVLLLAVDTQPKGQLSIQEFLFLQIRESSFDNRLSLPTDSQNRPVHLYQVSPSINTACSLFKDFDAF